MTFGFGVGIQRLGSVGVATLAELNAISPTAGTRPTGLVYGDATPVNNGVYTWTGSAWVRQRGLPDSTIAFEDVGGTANAITATPRPGIDPAQVVAAILIPAANNTGAVTLNGQAVTDRGGNALEAGMLAAGTATLLFRDGSAWRLMTGNLGEISDVSGLQAALDALQASIDGKANATHGHAIGDTSGLQAALDAKASLASPTFTGNPTAPTQTAGNNTTRIATTAFVKNAIDVVLGGVDAAFDTLAELAAGLATKLTASNNLADVANPATARINLGLPIMTAAEYRANTVGKVVTTDQAWAAGTPVNIGASLSGDLTLDLGAFIHARGTATGNIVLKAVSNPKSQSGTLRITASGANRTVGFDTAAFATPNNKALRAISAGTTMLYSYFYDSILSKIVIIEIGTIS